MKVLHRSPQQLTVGTPTRAVLLVRLIGLAISSPGLLVLAIFLLSGAADFSSLNCHRSRPTEQQCRFLRLSPIRPFYYRFPIAELKGTKIETDYQPQRGPTGWRLTLQVSERSFPLAVDYSSRIKRTEAIQARIREFVDDPASLSLILRDWPNLWGLILAVVFLVPTLPLSLLVLFLAAAPVVVKFNKPKGQVTASIGGCFWPTERHCSLGEVAQIYVQRTFVGQSSGVKQPTERFALLIVLRSGKQFLRYDYFQRAPAEEIAQVMEQFLRDDG